MTRNKQPSGIQLLLRDKEKEKSSIKWKYYSEIKLKQALHRSPRKRDLIVIRKTLMTI
jgi:hypothetical protein